MFWHLSPLAITPTCLVPMCARHLGYAAGFGVDDNHFRMIHLFAIKHPAKRFLRFYQFGVHLPRPPLKMGIHFVCPLPRYVQSLPCTPDDISNCTSQMACSDRT